MRSVTQQLAWCAIEIYFYSQDEATSTWGAKSASQNSDNFHVPVNALPDQTHSMPRQPITKSHTNFGLYTYFLVPYSLSYKSFLPSGPFCNSLGTCEQGLPSSWSVKVFVSPELSSLVIFNSIQHRGAGESLLAMFSFRWNVEIQQRKRHDCQLVAELRTHYSPFLLCSLSVVAAISCSQGLRP